MKIELVNVDKKACPKCNAPPWAIKWWIGKKVSKDKIWDSKSQCVFCGKLFIKPAELTFKGLFWEKIAKFKLDSLINQRYFSTVSLEGAKWVLKAVHDDYGTKVKIKEYEEKEG